MPQDTDEILVAAQGNIYIAPVGTSLPATEVATLNGSFIDLGYTTEEGTSLTYGQTTEDIGAWQSPDPVRRIRTGTSMTVTALATGTERVPAGHVFASSLLQGGAVTRLYTNGNVPSVTIRKTGAPISAMQPVAQVTTTSAAEPPLPQTPPVSAFAFTSAPLNATLKKRATPSACIGGKTRRCFTSS